MILVKQFMMPAVGLFLILPPCCIARGGLCVVFYVLFGVRSYIKFGLLLKGKQMLPLHFIRYNWPLLFVGILVTCCIKTAAWSGCSSQLSLASVSSGSQK
jgi:hypothetical protein